MATGEDPRVRFAAERTLLAWIRTGLALMGFGFVLARFGLFLRALEAGREEVRPRSPGMSLGIGATLVLLGVAVTLLAASQHLAFLKRLNRGEAYTAPSWSLGLIVAVVLAAVGIAMVAYLFMVGNH